MISIGDGGSSERWAQIRALFDRLAERSEQERKRVLEAARADDADLVREVESLLAANDQADEVLYDLEHPVVLANQGLLNDEAGTSDPYRLIGRTISHYRVLGLLSVGGMGIVYRAEDTKLRRSVALKFLPPFHQGDAEAKRRLTREAQAASALDHPNIGSVYEIGESEDGRLFIAMAFYEGESLREKIARGPLPISEALDLAIQVAEGLAAVHQRGIMHRDVKPANVMVTDGRAKVLDFGLATIVDATRTRHGQLMGTVAYMSPEQASAEDVDVRTDLWSLGVVLYEMITGERPFRGQREQSVIHSILNQEPAPPRTLRPDIPHALDTVVLRLLRKDPRARYPDAKALLSDLEAIRQSREPPTFARASRQVRFAAARRALAAVGALLLLTATIWGFAKRPWRAPDPSDGSVAVAAAPSEPVDASLTIAVLPFDNLSQDPADMYFADGVHEEILVRLGRIAALQVISRTSVLGYRDRVANIRTISDELGARYIVEGSVRRFSDRTVITAQLIDAATDSHLWGDSYERERQDLFAIQTDIAEQVADALRMRLSPEERTLVASIPTENAQAHELYLQARSLWSVADPDTAFSLIERALELDPDFALAFVQLASFHRVLYFRNVDPSPERLAMAKQAIDRALELDPDLPEAYLARGRYYYNGHRDYARALADYHRARRGLPNAPPLYIDLGYVYRRQGRFEDAASNFRAALDRSPFSSVAAFQLGGTLALLRDFDGAETSLRRVIAGNPSAKGARVMLAVMVFSRGTGRTDRAREVLSELTGPTAPPGDLAWVEVFLTERSFGEAIELLEQRSWDAIRMESFVLPRTLLLGRLHNWIGDHGRATIYLDSARAMLETELTASPGDSWLLSALGHALAGLGREQEAIEKALQATRSMPISTDVLDGAFRLQDLADVYANVGEPEKALEILDFLLSTPGPFWLGHLRTRPEWDALRDEPGYAVLLEKYGG